MNENHNKPTTTNPLITYLGNKRKLIEHIENALQEVLHKKKEEEQALRIFEPFCGSGSVSRMLKSYAHQLVVNDLEAYCLTLAKCYLASPTPTQVAEIQKNIDYLNAHKLSPTAPSFIRQHYAPQDDNHILPTERVYFTQRNAHIIDTMCQHIFHVIPPPERHMYLAPLLTECSIHTNTSGTFNSFHKKNGVGHFGGKGENALNRILRDIVLPMPIFAPHTTTTTTTTIDFYNEDANLLCKRLRQKGEWFDVAYLDPPYNKHPYGTNYFMLNIINTWDPTRRIPANYRGQPTDWLRSKYNSFKDCVVVFEELIRDIPATFLIISYNNEGLLAKEKVLEILNKYGRLIKEEQITYSTFKGCKNLASRNKKVLEYLWILQKNENKKKLVNM
jgi:adenine-specific DNA-methyltransferase